MPFKNNKVKRFVLDDKGELTGIRSVILFGKNVMSYKFALCDALLKLAPKSTYNYEEILTPFIDSFLEHVKKYPRQGISGGTFQESSVKFCEGSISREDLEKVAHQVIHRNVFTAFQVVGGAELDQNFSLFDWNSKNKQMTVKDSLIEIIENENLNKLIREENQSRWQIVEEAWKLGVSPSLIYYDEDTEQLIKYEDNLRVNLISAVDALIPYQKGKCFYCCRQMNRFGHASDNDHPEVDHVLPLSRLRDMNFSDGNINGLWNLVLACRDCNRDKSAEIPHKSFFEKLAKRNEYLIEEVIVLNVIRY